MTLQTTNGLNPEEYRVVKNLIDPSNKLSQEQIGLFLHVCKERKLDPRLKQIYAVPRSNSKTGNTELTIQVGIDGFRMIAERTGRYAPGKPTEFTFDKDGKLLSATAFIKKQTADGTWHEVSATAFYEEYVQRNKDHKTGEMVVAQFWRQMPCGQLEKCAEAKAIRKAFPGDMSGLYTTEEMAQAEPVEAKLEEALAESPKLDLRKEVQRLYDSLNDTQRSRVNVGLMRNQIDLEKATVEQLEFAMHGIKTVIGG